MVAGVAVPYLSISFETLKLYLEIQWNKFRNRTCIKNIEGIKTKCFS